MNILEVLANKTDEELEKICEEIIDEEYINEMFKIANGEVVEKEEENKKGED